MRSLRLALLAFASLALTAQQDAPLRGPGKFQGVATGTITAQVAGDASVTRFKTGARELYLMLNSDRMMALNAMVAVTVKLPASPTAGGAIDGVLSWESLVTHTRHAAPISGTLTFKGKDLLAGEFKISAKDGSETLSLTGTFVDAPVLAGVD